MGERVIGEQFLELSLLKQQRGWRRTFPSRPNGQASRIEVAKAQANINQHGSIQRWLRHLYTPDNRPEKIPWPLRVVPAEEGLLKQFYSPPTATMRLVTGVKIA